MFYSGIVEDINDPMKMGRVRVRIFGLHTEKRDTKKPAEYLPVSDLPFATPAYPINSPTISGEGNFGLPEQGSIVCLFFLDPEKQYPVYFATIPRFLSEMPDFKNGFSDPDKKYPKEETLNESPISRLARNEKIDETIVQEKRDNVKSGVQCAGSSFDEPETKYATKYPHNHVIQTRKHIIEVDDTDGAERISINHHSGTFEEIHPNGEKVENIKDSKTTIILKDDNILVEGNKNLHINGNCNVTVESNVNLDIKGDVTAMVEGKFDADITGNTNVNCDSKVTVHAKSTVEIDGGSGDISGVVTQNCFCPFTGQLHSDYSKDVIASK
jgi:hypothetical protein